MAVPYGILVLYAALSVWLGLLVAGFFRSSFRLFILFGVILVVVLNVRYLFAGAEASLAFFVGIYDVLDNLGVDPSVGAASLASCAENACTVWGERYTLHAAWAVVFYEQVVNGPMLRTVLLYAHLVCNTVVFVLMHVQLARPGGSNTWHKLVGRISFVLITIGTACAVWLSSDHGESEDPGAMIASIGFYSMSFFVYGSAVMGVLAIRRGDTVRHRIWMIRFAGAMWGAFWLFRLIPFIGGPFLRDVFGLDLLISLYFSTPVGILIAEIVRRKLLDRKSPAEAV